MMARRVQQRRMTLDDLRAHIDRRLAQALNREDGTLSQHRRELFNRYQGLPYGAHGPAAEREGYSSFRTREVMEAVEWALPSILDVFMASDRIVEFTAISAEDEEQAAQETDIVNHKILRANAGDGFLEIANFVKDALLHPTAYFKVYVDESERVEVHEVDNISEAALAEILRDDTLTIEEQTSRIEEVPTPPHLIAVGYPPTAPVEIFGLKIREVTTDYTLQIRGVPGEEVLIGSDLTSTNMDDAEFIAHKQRRSHSDLLKEGYDADTLADIRAGGHMSWSGEHANRMFYEDESVMDTFTNGEGAGLAERMYTVHEVYLQVDYDGDGKKEMRRVLMVGDTIFDNEEVNYQPFIAMSSLLNPHKHVGLSVAELVMDIQMLLTTLVRQLLDSVYQQNVGKMALNERAMLSDGSTLEAIANTQSRFVPVKGDPKMAVHPIVPPNIIRDLVPVIQDARSMAALRTGIAPENDVDPAVLQHAKTGAFMKAAEKANERLALIIRIMAETGFKPICRKVHKLLRMHPSLAETVKLRGEWVPVNPNDWAERTDMTVNVGLGYNTQEQTLHALTTLFSMQVDKLMPMGLAGPPQVYAVIDKFVRTLGIGATTQYVLDPATPGWRAPQPPPDPAMISAQAHMQSVQIDGHVRQAEVLQKQEESQGKLAVERFRAQTEADKTASAMQAKERELEGLEEDRALRHIAQENKDMLARAEVQHIVADTKLKIAQLTKALEEAETIRKKLEYVHVNAPISPEGVSMPGGQEAQAKGA